VTERHVPDAGVRVLVEQHKRRLYTYLQALLPGDNPARPFRETVSRIERNLNQSTAEVFVTSAEEIARQVASESRKTKSPLPFSDDLLRQLAETAGPVLDQYDRRPSALSEILRQLPPPEQQLLRETYSAGRSNAEVAAIVNRPVAEVCRDLVALRSGLVAALYRALPDNGPPPGGGATDLGRLADQLLDGPISDDGRLVLETLLLGDVAAQTHYHRHAALLADLDWTFGWPPALPDPPMAEKHGLSAREWVVTVAFVAAILAVTVFAFLRLAGHM
jgi:DNA-directed RNA polymerase specialized sigma24 family protein